MINIIRICILIILVLNATCSIIPDNIYNEDDNEKEKQNTINALILTAIADYNYRINTPNSTFMSRANAGLSAWEIGLQEDITGNSRNFSGPYDPTNWITVSGSNCIANGVPGSLTSDCPLTDSVIGVCEIRYYNEGAYIGKIADSTLIILNTFMESTDYSNEEKLSVFTHEIGHCIGFKHSNSTSDIMYFNTNGANIPSTEEKSAANEVYVPEPCCTAPAGAAALRYNQYTTYSIYHNSFPIFTISAGIGNGMVEAQTLPEPQPLEGDVTTIRHYMHEDGTCITEEY